MRNTRALLVILVALLTVSVASESFAAPASKVRLQKVHEVRGEPSAVGVVGDPVIEGQGEGHSKWSWRFLRGARLLSLQWGRRMSELTAQLVDR